MGCSFKHANLVNEMNELLKRLTTMDVFNNVKGFLELEKRHHEIAMGLNELSIEGKG
jgi:hypothetical protein